MNETQCWTLYYSGVEHMAPGPTTITPEGSVWPASWHCKLLNLH